VVIILLIVRQDGKKTVGSWKDGKAHGHVEVHNLKTGKIEKFEMNNGIIKDSDKCLIF
jgi:hypothetical protein